MAHSLGGAVLLAGDFNAYTASEPDWPEGEPDCPQRHNQYTAPINHHGRQLLELCRTCNVRLCNGRAPSPPAGRPPAMASAATAQRSSTTLPSALPYCRTR